MAQVFEAVELVERQKARRVRALAGVAGHKTGTDTDKIKSEFAAQKVISKHSTEVLAYFANLPTTGHNVKARKQARKFMGMRGHGCPEGEHMTFGKCQKVGTHEENEMQMQKLIQKIEESMEPSSPRAGIPDEIAEKRTAKILDSYKFGKIQRLADVLKDLASRADSGMGGYAASFANLEDPDLLSLGVQADEIMKRCSGEFSDMYAKVLKAEKEIGKRMKKSGMSVRYSSDLNDHGFRF